MTNYKKIFLDCGFHLGEGLIEFSNILQFDKNWEIYTFEANPACDIFNKIPQLECEIKAFNKAVWIHDNGVLFNQENNNSSNSPTTNSTSYLDGWGSCVSDIQSSHTYDSQIYIESIDFPTWIKQFKGNEIYCKMDIEGAEFPILRKMIEVGSISLIKEIWVEWHDVDLPNEDITTRNNLVEEISKFCKINNWK
jgi:FkbM family methyltransferase